MGLLIRSLQVALYRAPIERPVRTSFGVMRDRPALVVRVEDQDGAVGYGEVWCNFPPNAAEHRAGLLRTVLAPLIVGTEHDSPGTAFRALSERTAVLALQSGEPGPFAQCIAGIDIALWDLTARRAGAPLWRHLGGTTAAVKPYASGINPEEPAETCLAQKERGYRAFKLKVGFGRDRDIANLEAIRRAIGDGADVMIDANQGWTTEQALAMVKELEPFAPRWLEEPIRADSSWREWQTIARSARIPLAAGENLAGEAQFNAALKSGAIAIVQPDIAKWGGFSGCLPLARSIVAAGRLFCPHSLGGGIALLASAHLLAAAGGKGMLEVDCNPNPLRTNLCGMVTKVSDGTFQLPEDPGLGIEPDSRLLKEFEILL